MREVTFSLEREEAGWAVDLNTAQRDSPPPQARTLPSPRASNSEVGYPQVLSVARGLQRLMKVPQAGSARLEVRLALEDDRVSGWALSDWGSSGSGPKMPTSEAEVTLVINALRPFLNGLGERTVVLKLEGTHLAGMLRPNWYVVEARTLEPPPPPKELEDFGREYLAMRERILHESREGLREGALLLAGFSLEQVATMLIGGFVLKRALVLFEAVAPTVTSFLTRGGREAVRWFRNLLVRMPVAERQALQQLWLKAETQGLKALTEAEKAQLRALMGRLENLLTTKLHGTTKDRLREWARTEYFELYRPDFARLLGPVGRNSYDVHHICPLQYAHLFPKLDINGSANLAGAHKLVHQSINRVWGSLDPLADRMRPQDVTRVVEIINKHYSPWFHRVYDPSSASALTHAEKAALAELMALRLP
jgi:hypothetical protein